MIPLCTWLILINKRFDNAVRIPNRRASLLFATVHDNSVMVMVIMVVCTSEPVGSLVGIRLGSQAATTRGFGLKEFEKVGELITKVIKGLSENPDDNSKVENEVRNEVVNLCSNFPIYKNLNK